MFQLISQVKIVNQPKHLTLISNRCLHVTHNLYKDYYAVLNIERNSTKKNIKQAYYKMSKLYHPDVNKEEDAEAKFKQIQEAYQVLGDETRKIEYDRSLDNNDYSFNRYNQRHPFDRKQRSGPAHTTTRASDGGSTAYDFNDYYRSHYNDKYKSKSYSSYSSAYSASSKMSQEELNSYWNKQQFGSHDEVKDAYKRLTYSLVFSMIILFLMFNLINQALHREQKMARERADQVRFESKKI